MASYKRKRDANSERYSNDNSTSFQIQIPSPNTHFPTFTKPTILDSFSLDSKRTYIDGPVNLKFLQLPPKHFSKSQSVHYDLDSITKRISDKEWAERAISEEENHKETNELVQLIEWVRRNQDTFRQRKPNFVFYRGLMTKLLGTPYEFREGWKICGIQKNGTIYLRNIDTLEANEDRKRSRNDLRQRRMCSWGYNFEKFLLSDEPTSKPNPFPIPHGAGGTSSTGTDGECNLVFHSKLGNHSLIYIAEIDGVWLAEGSPNPKLEPEKLPQCKLVELKTTREFPGGNMSFNFKKFNLRKWWCQSFPVGVSHVIAGLRNDEGVVRSLEVFPVDSLPKLGANWAPTVMFNFLNEFLNEVKKLFGQDESHVYIFEFLPKSPDPGSFKVIKVTYEDVASSEYNLNNLI